MIPANQCYYGLLWKIPEGIKASFCFFAAILKIMEALQMAEDYMEKTADFSGRVSESQHIFLRCVSIFSDLSSVSVCPLQGLHHPEQ